VQTFIVYFRDSASNQRRDNVKNGFYWLAQRRILDVRRIADKDEHHKQHREENKYHAKYDHQPAFHVLLLISVIK